MRVIVVTPSLNKSFKFQSDWPYNNSQIYLLDSIIDDIKDDTDREFKLVDNGYEFKCKVNYPNNKKLVSQKVELDKKLNLKTVSVLDSDGNVQLKMTFDKIDLSPKFNDDYFKLNVILNNTKEDDKSNDIKEDEESTLDNTDDGDTAIDSNTNKSDNSNVSDDDIEKTKETATIEDIIYPMYLPKNTFLTNQEKIDTDTGERLILTFEGDNPFVLVEETILPATSNVIISSNGDLEFLTDVIGIVNEKSVSWVSNDIEYYLVSDVLETSELIEIAKSISVLPVSK